MQSNRNFKSIKPENNEEFSDFKTTYRIPVKTSLIQNSLKKGTEIQLSVPLIVCSTGPIARTVITLYITAAY